MTRKSSDSLNNSGEDWAPDEWELPAERGSEQSSRSPGHAGVIRRVALAVAVVLAGAVGIGSALGWFVNVPPASLTALTSQSPVDSGDETPTSSAPLAVATTVPGPLGDAAASEEAATTAVNSLVEASNEITQRADGDTVGIENIATGFVAGELESLAIERSQLGYTQTGDATITSVTTRSIDLTTTPPEITLEVCIDSSNIDVLDANGKSMKDRLYAPGAPTLHLYGAQFIDGLWKISTHEIPDNASCS